MKKNNLKWKETVLYFFFGILTTVINIIVYLVCFDYLGNVASTVAAWIASVCFAFVTNKIWVFESKSKNTFKLLKEIFSFTVFRLATGGLDLAFMFIGVSKLNFDHRMMKVISNIVVIILNYLFSKWFIFSKSRGLASNTK